MSTATPRGMHNDSDAESVMVDDVQDLLLFPATVVIMPVLAVILPIRLLLVSEKKMFPCASVVI